MSNYVLELSKKKEVKIVVRGVEVILSVSHGCSHNTTKIVIKDIHDDVIIPKNNKSEE